MLDRLEASDFSPSTGKVCALHLPDGGVLPVLVEAVNVRPKSRNPYAPEGTRLPFVVDLTVERQDCEFAHGPCAIELADGLQVEDVFVSRVAPAGRDPARAYYEIVFN